MDKNQTENSESKKNIKEVVNTLSNYFEVLVKKYPDPISQNELASLASVTPAAVSKIKDRLLPFCEMGALAYKSKLILKPDLTIFEVLLKNLVDKKNLLAVIQLFGTKYGEETIVKTDIHKWISEKIPFYSDLFSKEESKLGAKIAARYIRTFRSASDRLVKAQKAADYASSLNFLNPGDEGLLTGVFLGNAIGRSEFEWPIENAEDLKVFIVLRDKIFCSICKLFASMMESWSIFDQMETKREKNKFKKVYNVTFEFYLKKMFAVIDTSLEKTTKKIDLEFKKKYRIIGSNVPTKFMKILNNF